MCYLITLGGHSSFEQIAQVLSWQEFLHDVMYNDKYVVFCVSSLFKKLIFGTNVLSFSRTFLLSTSLDNEYHILNNQSHIYAATECDTRQNSREIYAYDEIVPIFSSSIKTLVLIIKIRQVTRMNGANRICRKLNGLGERRYPAYEV